MHRLKPLSDEEYQSETTFLKNQYKEDQVISEYLASLLVVPKTAQDLVDQLQTAIDITQYLQTSGFLELIQTQFFVYICTQCVIDLSKYRHLATSYLRKQVSDFLTLLEFDTVNLRSVASKDPSSPETWIHHS